MNSNIIYVPFSLSDGVSVSQPMLAAIRSQAEAAATAAASAATGAAAEATSRFSTIDIGPMFPEGDGESGNAAAEEKEPIFLLEDEGSPAGTRMDSVMANEDSTAQSASLPAVHETQMHASQQRVQALADELKATKLKALRKLRADAISSMRPAHARAYARARARARPGKMRADADAISSLEATLKTLRSEKAVLMLERAQSKPLPPPPRTASATVEAQTPSHASGDRAPGGPPAAALGSGDANGSNRLGNGRAGLG